MDTVQFGADNRNSSSSGIKGASVRSGVNPSGSDPVGSR